MSPSGYYPLQAGPPQGPGDPNLAVLAGLVVAGGVLASVWIEWRAWRRRWAH